MKALLREHPLSCAARVAVAAVHDRRIISRPCGGHRPPLPLLLALLVVWEVRAAPPPAVFQGAPGHFEVAALDAAAAEMVATMAEEGWQLLAAPLALPERFSTPVFVRLVPAAEWREAAPFRVIVEAGGVVSVRVRWGEPAPNQVLPRAIVQALLLRLAVAEHGVSEKLTVPLWLEIGCVGSWQTHADPAQLDALKQESSRFEPPAVADLLGWQRGGGDARRLTVGADWLLAWLQMESGRAGEWPGMLRRLLGGDDGTAALAASFPGRFADDRARELWWQTGWHHLRRMRALPALEARDSRAELAALTRFVFSADGCDRVVPLGSVFAQARAPAVDTELQRRGGELNRLLPALHPFYRNAGLSLAAALGARAATAGLQAARVAAFEQDWRDACELEASASAALDAVEQRSHLP